MRTYTEDDLQKMFEAGVAEGLALLENALLAHGFSLETVTRALRKRGRNGRKKRPRILNECSLPSLRVRQRSDFSGRFLTFVPG